MSRYQIWNPSELPIDTTAAAGLLTTSDRMPGPNVKAPVTPVGSTASRSGVFGTPPNAPRQSRPFPTVVDVLTSPTTMIPNVSGVTCLVEKRRPARVRHTFEPGGTCGVTDVVAEDGGVVVGQVHDVRSRPERHDLERDGRRPPDDLVPCDPEVEQDRIPFRFWIFRIAKNVLLEAGWPAQRPDRKRSFAGSDEGGAEALDQVADSITGVSRRIARDEGIAHFRSVVQQLPEDDRKLVLHCGLEGLALREVSERLGISEDAATKRWQRLRARLREGDLPEYLLAE